MYVMAAWYLQFNSTVYYNMQADGPTVAEPYIMSALNL